MKGFPKTLKTKDDYYNCLAMVAAGELAAADLLAKIESLEKQRYIQCAIVSVAEDKKAVTAVTHTQTDEAAAAGETGNDRTVLTLSKGIAADNTAIGLEKAAAVAGMTADDITALKGVLKQYE